jgi:hypothetical protein
MGPATVNAVSMAVSIAERHLSALQNDAQLKPHCIDPVMKNPGGKFQTRRSSRKTG